MDTSLKVHFLRRFLFTDKGFKHVMLNLILHNPPFRGLMPKKPDSPQTSRLTSQTRSQNYYFNTPSKTIKADLPYSV